ncbi:family 16 glycoside hydrolase [Frondihabitans cladoniiphilus]|uniref:3-keto-alpha-glucoside-1,2-lyase/3-keto-2-hydroxy-glucal hydratase domain-containing protein n=1 Tax=Frondihabitans cladoniiphilus TaxID=715785 RepID=A0ABP8VQP8_9MICO
MSDQDTVSHDGTRRLHLRRARDFLFGRRGLFSGRKAVAAVGVLLLAALWLTAQYAPFTQSGFTASVSGSTNTLGTNANFSPSGGVLPYSDAWPGGDLGWNTYNGSWATSGGVYSDTLGGGGGNKAVSGQPTWTDYTVQGDVRVNTSGQGGLLFRVQNPKNGTDALQGYYLGVYTLNGLVLGRQNNNYTQLASTTLFVPTVGTWYHVTAQVTGCTIVASIVQVGSTASPASFAYTDPAATCLTAGAIGVRDFNSTASFRNVTATVGGTTSTTVATYNAPFASSTSGWTTYGTGSTWTNTTAAETYNNTSGGQGEKSIAGVASWKNYTLTGDVQLVGTSSPSVSAGFLVRVSSPASGVNAFKGYYAGLSSSTLVVQESDGTTLSTLATANLPAALGTGTWYHLTVEAVGCTITATAQSKTGSVLTVAAATDANCSTTTTGQVGVRTVGTTASWRDVAVTPRA